MSRSRVLSRRGALGLAGLAAAAAPVFALALPDLEALARLERGRWQIGDPAGGAPHSVCLGDPAALVQLEHEGVSCGREVIASEANGATVQYSCPGRGYGHTSIRIETPRLARIDTQGLADGRPFAYRVEARRVGTC